MSSERIELLYLRVFWVADSDQSLEDQKAGKDQAQEVSTGQKDCTDC